jgi:cell fate (sporulation/competence/biofilm development) regulator YmcA (YheA/YmcA/DUF963 family)
MSKKDEFMDQVRDLDNQIAELELLREALYHRIDEEIEKEGKL